MNTILSRGTATLVMAGALLIGSGRARAAGGFQEDFLYQLDDVQKKLLSLEEAVPAKKMTWRPDKGIRSFSEVYLHTAFGNYGFLKSLGYEAPSDSGWVPGEAAKWDTRTTDPVEIKKVMEKSFDHVRATVKAMSDADLDKHVKMFGKFDMSVRNGLIALIGHLNEHLGQSIAYARSNKIVPPWSKKAPQ
jgi:uncharacterized damage-inducible protein DinB